MFLFMFTQISPRIYARIFLPMYVSTFLDICGIYISMYVAMSLRMYITIGLHMKVRDEQGAVELVG